MRHPMDPTHSREMLSGSIESGRPRRGVQALAGTRDPRRGQSATHMLTVIGIPALVAAIGVVAIVLWLRGGAGAGDIQPRLPEPPSAAGVSAVAPEAAASEPTSPAPAAQPGAAAGATPAASAAGPATVVAAAQVANTGTLPVAAAALPGAWPRFKGANLDGISTETTPLAKSWGPQGPAQVWSLKLGQGHAGAAVLNGRVYILDYDEAAKADTLRCLNLADGQQLWAQAYPVQIKPNHGISRTVPAVTDGHVLTIGPKCHVMCADPATGAVHWTMDLVKQYGTKVPSWYTGQCPLIDGDRAILAPAGRALMVAVDLASGTVLWETPNPKGWQMTYCSVVPATIGGQKMYLYNASGGVVGVSAEDGSLLWDTPEWTVKTANIPCPLPIGDGRIFLTGGYGAGAMMLRVNKAGGGFTPQTVYRLKANVFSSHQHTPILYDGHIYGVSSNKQLTCLDLDGNRLWTSGTSRFGLGPYIIANGMLYVLSEKGELALVEPTPEGYRELAKAQILNGPDAWGPLAIAGGLLLARDLTTMVCLDVRSP